MEQRQTVTGHVSVWATRLSWTALPALLRVFRRYGPITVYVTESSRAGLRLAWLLRRVGILSAEAQHVLYTRHGEHVDDPGSASFRIQAGVEEFAARFFRAYPDLLETLGVPGPRISSRRLLASLRSVAITNTYFLLAFVEFARYWHRVNGIPARRLVIVSPMAIPAGRIPSGWMGQEVECHGLWVRHQSLLFWLVRAVVQCVIEAVRRPRPGATHPASIGVECVDGLDRSARFNDLFWWWESGIPSERVVLFFDRADRPATREIVASAQRLGVRCVALNRQAIGDCPHLLWRPSPGLRVSLSRLWRKLHLVNWGLRHGATGRWVGCQLMQMACWGERLEDFMKDFTIRALFHYQETGMDYQSLVCDTVGAARIGFQWSHLPWPMIDNIRSHQVYFSWGRQSARFLQQIGSSIDHQLLSGCIDLRAHPGAPQNPQVMQQRAEVVAHGATRILALFDSSLPSERFYEFFLRRVLQDRRWGLLIKPKRETSVSWVAHHLPKLQSLYEQAQATGRVRMLDWQVSPATAATAADVSVGVSVVGICSSATVAALAGHRSIQLDYLRLHRSYLAEWASLYKAGPDRLVFDDPEKLWETLNRWFDDPSSQPALGVVDACILNDIDPFRDGQAGRRIGDYVRWYLDGVDQGLTRDAALAQATRRYAARWGAAAVSSGLPVELMASAQGVSEHNRMTPRPVAAALVDETP